MEYMTMEQHIKLKPCPFCGGEEITQSGHLVACQSNVCKRYGNNWFPVILWQTRTEPKTEFPKIRSYIKKQA